MSSFDLAVAAGVRDTLLVPTLGLMVAASLPWKGAMKRMGGNSYTTLSSQPQRSYPVLLFKLLKQINAENHLRAFLLSASGEDFWNGVLNTGNFLPRFPPTPLPILRRRGRLESNGERAEEGPSEPPSPFPP